jgi:hypothetical protein
LPKNLHIISFDVPYPPNYGGAIDVFYKIKALAQCGVRIYLHSFCYGNRLAAPELNKYCKAVYYYPRLAWWQINFYTKPYIVASRNGKDLAQNINKTSGENLVFCEGLHTTGALDVEELCMLPSFIRMHNIEWQYYAGLAASTKSLGRKLYYRHESFLLKNYESNLLLQHKNVAVYCITAPDTDYYKKLGFEAKYLPPFHGYGKITSKLGRGNYALYHGNLQVAENEKSVLWLIDNIFSKTEIPLVITGQNPSELLSKAAVKYRNVKLIANPRQHQLAQLIADAHVQVLPGFQATGIKLKLLHALFAGRFCLVTPQMVANTTLHEVCHVAAQPGNYLSQLEFLFLQDFEQAHIAQRENHLLPYFDDINNAKLLITQLGL